MGVTRRYSCAVAIGLMTVLFAAALGGRADWPTRPVKFILTLGPGAGSDIERADIRGSAQPGAGVSR